MRLSSTALSTILLWGPSAAAFSTSSSSSLLRRYNNNNNNDNNHISNKNNNRLLLLPRQSSAAASVPEFGATNNEAAVTRLEESVDTDQQEIESKLARMQERQNAGVYKVQLPLNNNNNNDNGLTFCQVDVGRKVQARTLDLGRRRTTAVATSSTAAPLIDSTVLRQLDASFRGVVVSAVDPSSTAYQLGIRPGDVVRAVSSRLGSAMFWPEASLEGIAAASAQTSSSQQQLGLELERLALETNVFELTLKKPLGFQITQNPDGQSVTVSAIAPTAPNLVQHALRVGDRVVAVDSSLGDKLWPVSTVEGVISACTARLPGQSITLRFERVTSASSSSSNVVSDEAPAEAVAQPLTTVASPEVTPNHKELIKRCQDVLRRYSAAGTAEEDSKAAVRTKLDTLPSLVADKVVDALATASVAVDSVTLSMLMKAYLSCDQANAALQLFEQAVGLKADASLEPVEAVVKEKDLVMNEAALNLYTGTILLQAHAQRGDFAAIQRVLLAMEGQSGQLVDGQEVAPWPWTGIFGSIQPDVVCYNVALAAANDLCQQDEAASSFAAHIFENRLRPPKTMFTSQDRRPERDLVTYNTYLSILGKDTAQSDQAFRLFDEMKRLKVRPDKYTYYALTKSCQTNDDLRELMYDMKENAVPVDAVIYNSMVENLCATRKWSQATRLIQEMEAAGVTPNSKTYGLLMNAMLHADKPHACLALFESACANVRTWGLTQSVQLYTTAITAATVLGDHERALELVARMTANGVTPNTKTLTSVMCACLADHQYGLAAQVFRRMDRPDGYAVAQGIRALSGAGDLELASDWLTGVKRREYRMKGKQQMYCYRDLLTACLEGQEWDLARHVYRDLLKRGFIPSKAITDGIIHALGILRSSVVEPTEDDKKRFQFLLFVLDGLQGRNLPVDGGLYAATLRLGRQMGGSERRLCNLMLAAKSTGSESNVVVLEDENDDKNGPQFLGWEDLLRESPKDSSRPRKIPPLPVRISNQNRKQVMWAEQSVVYNRNGKVSSTKESETPDLVTARS